ncbi:hypothetical protein FS842_009842 [Serendipita sp. 407]|nr:hypothetical protein FRC15_002420 [Serendipita sp. 397]KAG9052448.1 hypothetical protein FS842_009842 [Serendipita sp. 407]
MTDRSSLLLPVLVPVLRRFGAGYNPESASIASPLQFSHLKMIGAGLRLTGAVVVVAVVVVEEQGRRRDVGRIGGCGWNWFWLPSGPQIVAPWLEEGKGREENGKGGEGLDAVSGIHQAKSEL